jgi:hypothetical protein
MYMAKTNGAARPSFRGSNADIASARHGPRFAKLGVIVSRQPVFCCRDTGANFDPQDKTPIAVPSSASSKPFAAGCWQSAMTSAIVGGVLSAKAIWPEAGVLRPFGHCRDLSFSSAPHGVVGRFNTGFCGKKSNGRMTKSCHITGITGQSSARGT